MHYDWLLLLVTMAVLAHCCIVGRFFGLLTIDSIFVLTQWTMVAGTLVLLSPHNSADRLYAYVISVPTMLYIATSLILHWVMSTSGAPAVRPVERRVMLYRPTLAVWSLLGVSIAVTIGYFVAVGYSTFVLGIRGLFTGVTADYTTLRIDSYSTTRNLFPGYVNQFKNTILPSLTATVCIYLSGRRAAHRNIVAIPLVLISIVGLLGTGQRGAFILFCLTMLVFFFYWERRNFTRHVRSVCFVATPLLFVTTLILGRSSSGLGTDPGVLAKVTILGSELWKRFFHDNQFSGQMAFRYTSTRPIQDGKEWYTAVLGVLPSHPGSPLASQVFEALYGTDRGTSPPSMWGSVFYNFGWLGVVAIPIGLAIGYQLITHRVLLKRQMNTFELLGMAGTFAVCGSWIAGGPEYILNAGGVTFIILWWMGRRADLQIGRYCTSKDRE